jgi:hypothetical protein
MIRRVVAVGAVLALLGNLGYLLAGPIGVLTVLFVATAAAVLVIRATAMPMPPKPAARPTFDNGPSTRFHRFERISEMLGWAPLAGRHYEYGVRRVLRELVAQRLAETYRIDLDRNPDAARAVLGERCWPLVDPAQSFHLDESGVDLRRIEHLVSVLEEL